MNAKDKDEFPAVAQAAKWLTRVGVLGGGLLVVAAVVLGQFYRPYDVPEFADIDTSESAFLIPLDGDAAGQSAFPSIEFLNEKKVAAKRVQIPHRWQQTGRFPGNGHYVPTVRLIKVDRRPITREWTKHATTGTASKDQAIAVESKDSINFHMGVTITANIPEDMAAVFLYAYPSKSLADMLDMEVRGRVQQVIGEECARYVLDELPKKKNEIMSAVRTDVVPFFKERGIAITSIGLYGGLTYDNPEIQKAIDDSAKAAQLKVVAEAKREAQEVENKRLRMEAEGRVEAAKMEAKGKAESDALRAESEARAKLTVAKAEAEGMKALADARVYEAERAAEVSGPYLQLRAMEAEAARWKTWDGKFPTHWVNGLSPFAALFPPAAVGEAVSAKK
jgi:regulator of protease activity HflC (stomatin/prohibitin superfamily)